MDYSERSNFEVRWKETLEKVVYFRDPNFITSLKLPFEKSFSTNIHNHFSDSYNTEETLLMNIVVYYSVTDPYDFYRGPSILRIKRLSLSSLR